MDHHSFVTSFQLFLQLQLTQETASLGLARRVAAPFGPGQVEHQPHVFVEDTGPRSWLLLELLGFRLGVPNHDLGTNSSHGYKHMWFQYGVYMCLLIIKYYFKKIMVGSSWVKMVGPIQCVAGYLPSGLEARPLNWMTSWLETVCGSACCGARDRKLRKIQLGL
jgi:hypothetical protein